MSVFTFDRRIIDASEYPWGTDKHLNLWTPTSSMCWLLSSPANLTLVSRFISSWNDKTTNARHFTQSTSGNRPEPGLNTQLKQNQLSDSEWGVGFTGTAWMYKSGFFSMQSVCVIILVRCFTLPSSGVLKMFLGARGTDPAGNDRFYLGIQNNSGTNTFYSRIGGGANDTLLSASADSNFHILRMQSLNNVHAFYVDGVLKDSVANAHAGTTPAHIGLGGLVDSGGTSAGNNLAGGDMTEVVFLNSDANARRTEGYLAHKWGITGNLPSDHPYKTRAPRT